VQWIYEHPWVFLPLLFLAASLFLCGVVGLIIQAADRPPVMSDRAEQLRALEQAQKKPSWRPS